MTDKVWRPSVTVVIPTLNAGRTLQEVLSAIQNQQGFDTVDVLVIDSSSTDDTEDIARSFANVEFHRIERAEFGHGRTRQRAAELANGEVVVYLTQDATPASPDWLAHIVAPLAEPSVAGVFGRQIPRPGCPPILKYDIERVFANPAPGFYSDANSAMRRATLLGPVPFRDVNFSEDFCFAADAAASNLHIRYAPDAAVWHSNDIPLSQFAERMRSEVRGHALAGHPLPHYGWVGGMARAVVRAIQENVRILGDTQYGLGATVKWLVVNPCFHVARWIGIITASRAHPHLSRGE
ncbi:MAG: glycosyltransferase family 2 protein [Microbacteriaceae bacterium]